MLAQEDAANSFREETWPSTSDARQHGAQGAGLTPPQQSWHSELQGWRDARTTDATIGVCQEQG